LPSIAWLAVVAGWVRAGRAEGSVRSIVAGIGNRSSRWLERRGIRQDAHRQLSILKNHASRMPKTDFRGHADAVSPALYQVFRGASPSVPGTGFGRMRNRTRILA
jgi:hypothetical protein